MIQKIHNHLPLHFVEQLKLNTARYNHLPLPLLRLYHPTIRIAILCKSKQHVYSLSAMKRDDVAISMISWMLLFLFLIPLSTNAFSFSSLHRQAVFRPTVQRQSTAFRLEKTSREFHAGGSRIGKVTRLEVFPHQSSISASMALVGSSALGMLSDRWIPSSGIPITLAGAAIVSNLLPMVPIAHPLYDLCWSWILPGSLALLLLGYQTNASPAKSSLDEEKSKTSEQRIILQAVARVACPFVLASIGSIIGCWAAFRLAISGTWFSSMESARAATACLAASYVGGSVNLFATAKIIGAPSSLLSSMATADLIAMAMYFSLLASSLEWKWFKGLFYETRDAISTTIEFNGDETTPQQVLTSSKTTIWTTLVPLLLLLTGSIVAVANWVESYVGRWIPGTACGVIAMVAPLVRSVLVNQSSWLRDYSPIWSATASTMADWFFFLFFAAIGVGVDLKAMLQMGPACLMVSVLALAVHLVVIVVGSRLFLPVRKWGISLEDLWIASNAAIGGPATAAAFCNRMKGESLLGRTVAATVWGVVGYAVGTVIGVGLFRFLGGTMT